MTQAWHLPRLRERLRTRRLSNGLTLCLLENRNAPLVTTALCYRAGSRHEPPEQCGVAHFLEHMMFKGTAGYAAGDIDRRTQLLGGASNAYTSHDGTLYYFSFASDRWTEALDVESARMATLTLDAAEVEAERRVILEELAEVADDPWDALDQAVRAELFGGHPYGLPILGKAETLPVVGRRQLADFHRRRYGPDNAVLAIAGDVGPEALEVAAERLGGLPSRGPDLGSATAPEATEPARWPQGLTRLTRRRGEVPRLLLALPAPPAPTADYAALRVLLTLLTGGRASRLQRALVDEGQLCADVGSDLSETVEPGMASIAVELVPGAEPERVEELLLAELRRAVEGPLAEEEVARARQLLWADWVFANERVQEQALLVAQAAGLFGLDYLDGHMDDVAACDAARLADVGRRYLQPDAGSVVGWSLPREE